MTQMLAHHSEVEHSEDPFAMASQLDETLQNLSCLSEELEPGALDQLYQLHANIEKARSRYAPSKSDAAPT